MAKKEKMIDLKLFREYFEYLSPTDMYKNLNKTAGSEENKAPVDTINDRFPYLMEEFKSNSTSDAKKKIIAEITCSILWNLFLSLTN